MSDNILERWIDMNRKKFYTMMENLENVHLIKDVGMFPYVLQKEGYFDSYIVGYGVAHPCPAAHSPRPRV